MESTAFFEKKISLTPHDFNKLKTIPIDDILITKSKEIMENTCSEHGFVLPGSLKLLSRSMGYFESARFTGDAVYYVKLEGKVIYPADGIRVIGKVIRKNKMGLYVDYKQAIRVQVPRDLHLGNEEFDAVEIDQEIEVELKRSKFQIHDPYILASGIYISTYAPFTPPFTPPSDKNKQQGGENQEYKKEDHDQEDDTDVEEEDDQENEENNEDEEDEDEEDEEDEDEEDEEDEDKEEND